ncbi:hypothetical protein Leryth_017211 [Lithospermum erythrorhizon]|nr:hypothetical protein Leryth_017211 [Lithospermum erythrorhizon]
MLKKSSNKPKKCFVTEENTSILLQRYTATTVLTLLQEVAQMGGVKIDWNKMVRKTATGITNAREYQMLWRHLAYQDPLLDRLENGTEPLDGDSDLECELEAFPAVDAEASSEAVACVKVLIASGLSNDAHGTNGSTVEAPLTINIPQNHASYTSSLNHEFSSHMRRKNITVPISVRKQPLPSTNPLNLEYTGPATSNGASKRKNAWSEQEDQELLEAVREHGEGNWAAIIKGPFKTGKTAAQLSKRWTILKKKQKDTNLGAGSQLSEAQLATRRAMSLALNMPMGDNLKSFKAGSSLHVASGSTAHHSAAESSLVGSQFRARAQQDPSPLAAECPAVAETSRSRVASKNPQTKMSVSPDRVKEAAVAAGARIATPSDFPSLFMAAQSKNAVHIKSGCNPMMKPSMPSNVNQLPSNVHFIRTGLINKPLSTHACMSNASRHGSSHEVLANLAKPEVAAVKSNPEDIIVLLGASSQVNNGATSNLTSKHEVKPVGMTTDASADHAARVLCKNNNSEVVSSLPMSEASGNQAVSSSVAGKVQMDQSSFPSNNVNESSDDNKRNSSLGTEAKEPCEKDAVSVSGSDMKEVQPNSLSTIDTVIHDHCQAKEKGISSANGTNDSEDVTKDIREAEKLEHMDVSDEK